MLLYPSGILPSDKSLLEIESIYFATLSSWLFNPDSSKLDSLNAVRKSFSSFFLDWSESFILKDFNTDMRHQKQKREKGGISTLFYFCSTDTWVTDEAWPACIWSAYVLPASIVLILPALNRYTIAASPCDNDTCWLFVIV